MSNEQIDGCAERMKMPHRTIGRMAAPNESKAGLTESAVRAAVRHAQSAADDRFALRRLADH
jgi:hypothetical protein